MYLLFAEEVAPLIELWDSPFQHPLPWVRASLCISPLVTSCTSVKAGGSAQNPNQVFPEFRGEQLFCCDVQRD